MDMILTPHFQGFTLFNPTIGNRIKTFWKIQW